MTCKQVLTLLSPLKVLGRPVIAGGAVRDELMNKLPKDFDVFLLTGNKWSDQVATVVKQITQNYPEVKAVVEWHKSEPFLIKSIKIAEHEIQLMQSPFDSVESLLASFDWNVSLFAHDGSHFVMNEDIANITVGKTLRLNKVTTPLSTLQRGFRFSERFLMQLRKEDVQHLCKLILDKKSETVAGNANH